MSRLDTPWEVDEQGERIYIYAPGEVCVDICSGTKEDRARVMALLRQTQRMARLIRDAVRHNGMDLHHAEAVLRDSGVLP